VASSTRSTGVERAAPGAVIAAIVSPSSSRSPGKVASAVTIVPFSIRVRTFTASGRIIGPLARPVLYTHAMPEIAFTLNGVERRLEIAAGETLLELLRERCGIVSTKDGCAPQAQCGCCLALVDGNPKTTCAVVAEKADGTEILTWEGVSAAERELDAMVAAGVPSFKLFMAYPGRLMLDDGAIFRVLLRARENGGRVCLHAENGHVIQVLVERALAAGHTAPKYHAETRPARAEAEAVHRAAALAEIAGAPVFIVHLSSPEALEEVERARARGVEIHAETCPQYLLLSDERYEEEDFAGARYVMSPPLRARAAQEPLWRALAGGAIQTVATDHCPFSLADKARGASDFSRIPNGAPGIETRLQLLWDSGVRTGRLSMNRFVEVVSTAPARIFGLYPRKGALAVGSDADLVLWDPERSTTISAATHHSRVDYSSYEGRQVTGGPETVISRGRVIVDRGRFVGQPGAGRFLRRAVRGG